MPIHVLSEQLASQIAAGEVVERPFSVVKELAENSIDAGATTITVDIRGGGRQLVQVSDNGSGIPAEELETAFRRHATSKLNSVDDLRAIRTLGFRGEALASIAAVSRLTVVSREREARQGTRLALEAGVVGERETVGAPAGTVIAVEDLFYNVPARLKFLKSINTEKRLIDEFITRYALAYPAIRFRLTHDNRITFQTTGTGSLEEVLLAVYGPETLRQLVAVAESGPERAAEAAVAVTGFVSDPALNWANRQHINLFVNGRWVRDNRLTFAVVQAYHTLLPTGRYPLGLLFITMPPEDVDVNVHPTKVEVRFRDEGLMFGAVQRAVRQSLLATTPVRDLGSWAGSPTMDGWTGVDPRVFVRREAEPTQLDIDWRPQVGVPEAAENGDGRAPLVEPDETRLPVMRVVGQVGAAYIITEGPDGLFLIDQHAAHERILYEQFLAAWNERQVASQGLVAPATVYLSPAQGHLLEENLPLLTSLGFAIEPFGPNTFQVRGVPAILARTDPAQSVQLVIGDLENEATPLQATTEALIIKRVCKTAAVKAGQTLSREEMEQMIVQLEACAAPHTCPHGRPTLIHLSAAQLARHFGRT